MEQVDNSIGEIRRIWIDGNLVQFHQSPHSPVRLSAEILDENIEVTIYQTEALRDAEGAVMERMSSVICLDEQPDPFHFAAPIGMDIEYSPDGETWYAHGVSYAGMTRYLRTVPSIPALEQMPTEVLAQIVGPTSEPVTPPSPVLPPGSICETCFDAPATRLLPAPWGGEMGVCAGCAAGKDNEAPDLPTMPTSEEALGHMQASVIDALRRHLVPLSEAQEVFSRLGDALRTFPEGTLDDLVIHPSR